MKCYHKFIGKHMEIAPVITMPDCKEHQCCKMRGMTRSHPTTSFENISGYPIICIDIERFNDVIITRCCPIWLEVNILNAIPSNHTSFFIFGVSQSCNRCGTIYNCPCRDILNKNELAKGCKRLELPCTCKPCQ